MLYRFKSGYWYLTFGIEQDIKLSDALVFYMISIFGLPIVVSIVFELMNDYQQMNNEINSGKSYIGSIYTNCITTLLFYGIGLCFFVFN